MTQKKEELLAAKARLEERLKDTEISKDQRQVIQDGLDGLNDELSQLQAPTPPSVKNEKKGTKKEKTDEEKAAFGAKMKAARAAKVEEKKKESTPILPAQEPKSKGIGTHIGTARIDCDFEIFQNDTGSTVQVPNINGNMEAKNGDYVLYLPEDGESFTVIKKSAFGKRCTIITSANAKPSVQAWTPPMEQPKPEASKPMEQPKPEASKPMEQPQEHAHKVVKEVVKEMTKQGCEVHTFLKETQNTPLDAWIQGKIIEFTTGKTDEMIDRVYIDTEHGDFYAKIIFKSAAGWFAKPKYVKVCPERGIETVVDGKEVEGKKYRVQYGKDKLRAMYHYPEDVTGCRSLAKEIYKIRAEHGDSSGKYQTYTNNCRNPQWTKKYDSFIKWMHQSAMEYRKDRPSMSHGEALSHIAKEMRVAAKS